MRLANNGSSSGGLAQNGAVTPDSHHRRRAHPLRLREHLPAVSTVGRTPRRPRDRIRRPAGVLFPTPTHRVSLAVAYFSESLHDSQRDASKLKHRIGKLFRLSAKPVDSCVVELIHYQWPVFAAHRHVWRRTIISSRSPHRRVESQRAALISSLRKLHS